jgi:hypothetical protein
LFLPTQILKFFENPSWGFRCVSDLEKQFRNMETDFQAQVAAAASRQKSCNACVRSKRRCDKRTPKCTRCAEKNYACVYQNVPSTSTGAAADDVEQRNAMDVEPSVSLPPPSGHFDAISAGFHLDTSNAPGLDALDPNCMMDSDPASTHMNLEFDYSALSFLTQSHLGNSDMSNLELWSIAAQPKEPEPAPPEPASQDLRVLNDGDYAHLHNMCVSHH